MNLLNILRSHAAILAVVTLFALAGCGSPSDTPSAANEESHEGHNHAEGEHEATHDHSGWWCPEHGVPEGECTRCDSSLIAEFKAKEDWCDEHDRPESQCFLCTPELEAKFAARYEAKYGKEPPKPTDL